MPAGHLPVVSYLAVPVISRSGTVLGGLFFGHSDEGVFTENEEQIVEALAAQAAVAIDNARLYAELQRERARYKTLVFAAPTQQALWLASASGEVFDDLPGWRDITGQSLEEIRGGGWAEAIHPDDREPALRAWREAVQAQQPYMREYRVRVADGAYRWFATTGVPVLDERGVPLEWVGTAIDIHERRNTEDNLRFLAHVTELLASSLDYETTLTTVAALAVPAIADWCAVDVADEEGNVRRLAVAHVDPAKVELAHDFRRRYPPNPETDAVVRVIRTGRTDWMHEIPGELIDRAARNPEHLASIRELGLLSYIIAPLRVQDRVFGTLSFVFSDSRRRYSESDVAFAEELARRAAVAIENARLYGSAREANRAKDEFLATLSHELRTPMTAVLGWARMLRMGLGPEESQEAVDAIEKSATVQMQLIEDILDMSRIMAGKMRIDATPVDVRDVTEAALSTVRPAAAAKGIELSTRYAPYLPPVAGDAGRLQQVVWNLLTNAVKFTPRGGTIEVGIGGANGCVTIVVQDTGAGIEPEFLPHVFERFRQQDSSTTRAYGGIGIGLAIVRYLVEMHGGRINAESEGTGRGARFTVELPALASPSRAHEAPRPVTELPSLEGLSVLVIDDEVLTRDVIAAILRRCRADVATAESARSAHALLDERTPDVIVCDIAMPAEDGYTFVRTLREREERIARIPVVALTAFGRAEDREHALRNGFDAFVKKPVDPVVLATTVRGVRTER